jgi:hypothetical protein
MQVRAANGESSSNQSSPCEQARIACNACPDVNGHNIDMLSLMVDGEEEQDPQPHIAPERKQEHKS